MRSPSLAENVVVGLHVLGKMTNELLSRITPSGVLWWKMQAPAPNWRPEAAQPDAERLSELFAAIRIDRLTVDRFYVE